MSVKITIQIRGSSTMRKQTVLKSISIALAAALVVTSFAGCSKKAATDNEILLDDSGEKKYVEQNYERIAENVRKEETVYVNLKKDGSVEQVSVTDWLHTDTPQTKIMDTSSLKDVRNIKSLAEAHKDGDFLYWNMDTTDLYYSGTTDQKPPVQFKITYYLDGTEISADDIAGKSGNVKMVIKAENTLKRNVRIDSKKYTVCCPMLLAGGMILPEDVFTNISVENGSTLSDGAKQIAFFVGIPGMDESLGLSSLQSSLIDASMYSDTFTITAQAQNFQLGNMMFAVMPFSSLGSFGNGSLPNTIDEVKGVLSDIENIRAAMHGLDLNKIINMLYGDSNKIEDMMNAVEEAVTLYSQNEKLIKTFGKYMTQENLQKLGKLVDDLENADLEQISSTLNDPAVQVLLKILPNLSASFSDLSTIANDLNDVMPIMQAMSQDMDDPEVKASLEKLPQTLEKLKSILAVMEQNQDMLEMVGSLADADNSKKIDAIMKTAEKYTGAANLSEAQTKALTGRMKEWLTFGMEYDISTKKTDTEKSSVLFTYKTEAIEVPVTVAQTAQETQEVGFLQRIKNMFR